MDSKSKYMDMDSDNNSIKFIDITRKSIDIGVIYVVYFIYAFILLYICEMLLGPSTSTSETPTAMLIFEMILIIFVFGIVGHYSQDLIKKYVSYFRFYMNDTSPNTEFSEGTWVLFYVFLTCSVNIRNRVYILYNRIIGTDTPIVYRTVKNSLPLFRR